MGFPNHTGRMAAATKKAQAKIAHSGFVFDTPIFFPDIFLILSKKGTLMAPVF